MRCPHFVSLLAPVAAAALAAAPAFTQQAGVHRMYSPRLSSTTTYLVDQQGVEIHTWPSSFLAGVSVYMKDDGNLFRTIQTGYGGPGAGGGIQELAFDGTVVWDFRYDTGGVHAHHDIEPMPNGNVLVIAWEDRTAQEALDAGMDPRFVSGLIQPDHIIEVKPTGPTTGDIVWEWHVWDHLIQDYDDTKQNYGVVQDHPELIDINYPPMVQPQGELNHFNSVDYDEQRDLIVISSAFQNEIWIIDHSTTTAEAASHAGGAHGKGGDLLYRWGNPAAYRRGTPQDQVLFFQHSAKVVPERHPGAGNVTIFNNQALPTSEVLEIVLPINAQGRFFLLATGVYGPPGPIWRYQSPEFSSSLMSSAERLPNGNTLICSSFESRIFEVSPAGQVVWEITPGGFGFGFAFHSTYVRRSIWSDKKTLSTSAGGTVQYDLVAGSPFEDDIYLLLGTVSGTSPGIPFGGKKIPLNPDGYLTYTLSVRGSPLFVAQGGVCDAVGSATTQLVIPPGLFVGLEGLEMHHAFVVIDPVTAFPTHVSFAESLVFTP
ncbi:MAG: aryl-sulfate sulfotransferase [Planctomycetota bacterium]